MLSSPRGPAQLSARQERALVRAARGGSEEAIERLFREYWPRAYRAARLVTRDPAASEDIAQEAFLAAIRKLDQFDWRRRLGPWIHRIAVNRAIDHTRGRALRREAGPDGLERLPDPGVRSALDGPEPALEQALAQLSPEHRAVVAMRFVLEFTPGEIARELGIPRGTVNSRLRRALDDLAEALGGSP